MTKDLLITVYSYRFVVMFTIDLTVLQDPGNKTMAGSM